MRKKYLKVMSVVLVAALASASLAGCGTRASATDQEVVMEEKPFIVTDDEFSEDITIETEDEITATEEVIADDGEEVDADASYTEHEYFYVRDELDMTDATPMDMNALDVAGTTYALNESVNIYMPSTGALKGYTKPNIDVYVNSFNDEWYCLYFENEESPNNYVLVKADDFIASSGMYENMPAVTANDVKLALMNQLYNAYDGIDEVYYVALDDTVEEMDLTAEFTVPTYCKDLDEAIEPIIADGNFGSYKYFHFEKVEEKSDEENSCFKVTYGALQGVAE
ncbi:MAG: hypothetical protein NC489_42765 [Ruminococcus flavefaciens]|nr:hypothetical protein [Ruminococcus flavefaciens]